MCSWYQAPRPSLQRRDRKFVCKDQDHILLQGVSNCLLLHTPQSLMCSWYHAPRPSLQRADVEFECKYQDRIRLQGVRTEVCIMQLAIHETCASCLPCKTLSELSLLFTRGGMHLVCTFCPDIFTVKVKLQSLIPVHIRKLNFHLNSETRPKAKAILNKQVMIFLNLLKLK